MTADRETIEGLLRHATELPTLPSTVVHVVQMAEDPNCSLEELAKVVMTDPPLACRVLKLANSEHYGFAQSITSVQQAITLLGTSGLKSVLLSASVFDFFAHSDSYIEAAGLWTHSVACAAASKLIAERIHFPSVDKAYTVGLLHDIGKFAIARYLPRHLREIGDMVRNEECAVYDAEMHVLGTNHTEIGGYLLERWKMPVSICAAVEYHHHPTRSSSHFYIASIACLGNVIAHRAGIGHSGDTMERELDPMVRDYFSLAPKDLLRLQDEVVSKRGEIEALSAQ